MLSELLQAFVDADVQIPVKHCVLACAGQIMGDEVMNDNLAWPIHLTQLRHALSWVANGRRRPESRCFPL